MELMVFLFLAGPGSHIFYIGFGLVLSRRGRGPNTIFNGASCNIPCKESAIVVSYVLEEFSARHKYHLLCCWPAAGGLLPTPAPAPEAQPHRC